MLKLPIKSPIVSETCSRLGGQGENEESPAVQSDRALPMGRRAIPPWYSGSSHGVAGMREGGGEGQGGLAPRKYAGVVCCPKNIF